MAEFTTSDRERIDSTVLSVVAEYHLPGIAVGVVSKNQLAYARGVGYADIESRRPQCLSLRQRIGSITKTMTGLCVMALVDEDRLSLDDRVVDRLPDLALNGPAEALTVKHLLTHTGGIGEAPTMADYHDPWAALWADGPDSPGVPDAYSSGIDIEAHPGTKWAYANHAFALLGEIVARIENQPIEEVLRSRIYGPLGMTNTDCLDRPNADLAACYHRPPGQDELDSLEVLGRDAPEEEPVDGHNIRGRYQYVAPGAAGAVQSTIPDMARYAAALLRRGGGIVRPETFDSMVAPHWCPDDRLTNQGLVFHRRRRFGRVTFGHGGGVVGGWNTHLTLVPNDDLALLVHMNLFFDDFSQVEGRILQAVLDAPDRTRSDLPYDRAVRAVIAAAPGVYEPAPGYLTNWRTIKGTGRVQIKAEGEGLVVQARRGPWRNGVRMLPADADDPTFFVLETGGPEPPGIALVLDQGGAVSELRFDRMVRMLRNDRLEPWS